MVPHLVSELYMCAVMLYRHLKSVFLCAVYMPLRHVKCVFLRAVCAIEICDLCISVCSTCQ